MNALIEQTAGVKPVGRVLVLGGSSFIGYTTTLQLLEDKYSVHLANRGNIYWNHDLRSNAEVTHITADRKDPDQFAEALRLASKEEPWLAVVDFTAYKVADIECALKGLQDNFGVYIYISTDSVYEVCCKERWLKHSLVKEDQACRPMDPKDQYILNKLDRYGHRKLQCEEALHMFAIQRKKPVVALRLADVIGPFDDTRRLWAYWWWCRFSDFSPIYLTTSVRPIESVVALIQVQDEDGETQPLNFTYSGDVAAAVLHVIRQYSTVQSDGALGNTFFEAINVACEEAVTLEELLVLLNKLSGFVCPPHFCTFRQKGSRASHEKTRVFLPSVCRKAPLSVEKFKAVFKQTPTRLDQALEKTCQWFSEAVDMFPVHLVWMVNDGKCIPKKLSKIHLCVTYNYASEHPDEAAKAALRIPRNAKQRALTLLQCDRTLSAGSSSSSTSSSSSSGSSSDEDNPS